MEDSGELVKSMMKDDPNFILFWFFCFVILKNRIKIGTVVKENYLIMC
jgi:hypothetical protein